MMQQIASAKSDSAASVLPLQIAKTNDTMRGNTQNDMQGRNGANDAFSQESERVSAFDTAFDRARRDTQRDAQRDSQRDTTRDSSGDSNSALNNNPSKRTNTSSASNERRADSKTDPENSTGSRQNKESDKASGSTTKTAVDKSESLEQQNAGDEKLVTNDKIAKTSEEVKTGIHDDISNEELSTPKDDFDYISFVTQLADFTGNSTEANFDIESQGKILSDKDLTIQVNISGEGSDEAEAEFITVSLSKKELQSILDAQNVNLDLNAELTTEDAAKLDGIISAMLQQLHSQNDSKSPLADSENIQLADKALLTSLLINKKMVAQQPGERAVNTNAIQEQLLGSVASLDASASKSVQVNTVISEQLSSEAAKKAEIANASTQTEALPNETTDNDLKAKALLNGSNVWSKTPDLSAKIPGIDTWSKTPDTNDKKLNTPLQNIAALDEQQTADALNSLSERVQSIVTDLKTPAKGSEFVIALQSGVKEFKQQLASGREPGIDLKALIADAIASTNVEVSDKSQPKIDAALNQFNAVLNLANAVNYSATQQQAQVLGLTDNQFAKEMNILQTEGTKLANAVNNQLNSQAMSDKAINIFKAEGQQQLAEKVRWMVNSRNPSAEIRLDPPDLGGMQIKVNLSGDTAQVNFSVQSLSAKEALDQAVPRLRDMLAQQGIELGQSSVNQESQQQQSGEQEDTSFANNSGSFGSNENASELADEQNIGAIEQRIVSGSIGGIDHYA